jgi:hypothetical protein
MDQNISKVIAEFVGDMDKLLPPCPTYLFEEISEKTIQKIMNLDKDLNSYSMFAVNELIHKIHEFGQGKYYIGTSYVVDLDPVCGAYLYKVVAGREMTRFDKLQNCLYQFVLNVIHVARKANTRSNSAIIHHINFHLIPPDSLVF